MFSEDQNYPRSNDLFYWLNWKEPERGKCSLMDSFKSVYYQFLELKTLWNIQLKQACSSQYHWQQVWFRFAENGFYLGILYEDGCYSASACFLLTRSAYFDIFCLLRLCSFQKHDQKSIYYSAWTDW